MAENFSRTASQQGAEELTAFVNKFLELLITTTVAYGGDLQKFGGDSGLILFTGEEHTLRASAAALDIRGVIVAEMQEVQTSLGTFPLDIAIGLSTGPVVGVGLGDGERREWLLSGPTLMRAGQAQTQARANEIVLDATNLDLAHLEIEIESTSQNHPLYVVTGIRRQPSPSTVPSLPPLPRPGAAQQIPWLLTRLDQLTPYLSKGLLKRLLTVTTPNRTHLWSEHRNVTILMLAFTGFPPLTDFWEAPLELREAVKRPNELFRTAYEIIEQYDGMVNKIGLGPEGAYLMAVFGAPVAHEDDPLRAVLAAFDLHERWDSPLKIAINSGFVFAGDVGTDERREYTVMGDEVNVAYRLMICCRPGEVWLGPNTAQHPVVARRIEGENGSPQTLKGKSVSVTPFIAQGVQQTYAGVETEDLPFVGREGERSQLLTALHSTLAGHTQRVLVHSAVGMGKSRLVHKLTDMASSQGVVAHIGAAPSYGAHLPYAAWEVPLREALGLDVCTGVDRTECFQKHLERAGQSEWAALLAPLVGLNVPPSPEVTNLPPEIREEQRQTALHQLLTVLAKEQPRLLILENVHWMPGPSIDLVMSLLENPPEAPLMVVLTMRDDEENEAALQPHVDLDLNLGPLSRKQILTLAHEVVGAQELPSGLERWLVKQGGGSPLFTIEAVRVLLASGTLQRHEEGWRLTRSLETTPLPETTYGIIQSRIDQLEPPSRHLLRSATVVGEQMTVKMLVRGYGEEPQGVVERRLPSLNPLGLVYGDPRHETLVFRQPLVREVAYRGLPYQIRQQIHRRLATYLDSQRERATSNWLTLLAHHTFEGQMWEMAMEINLSLGRRALDNYLTEQAIQAFERVLQASEVAQIRAPEARFEAHHALGEALTIVGQYEQALEHFSKAKGQISTPVEQEGEAARLANLEYHVASVLKAQGKYEEAFETIERALQLSGVRTTLEGARLYLAGAGMHYHQGDYEQVVSSATEVIELTQALSSGEATRLQARALYLMALVNYKQSNLQRALDLGQESLQIYQRVHDLVGQVDAHTNLLVLHLLLGEWSSAAEHGEKALHMARRIHYTEGEMRAAGNLGEIYRYQGRLEEAKTAYGTVLRIVRELGIVYGEAVMENNLAAVAIQQEDWEEAERRLENAEEILKQIGSGTTFPELYRHRGEVALALGEEEEALTYAQQCLQLTQERADRQEMGRAQAFLAEVYLKIDRPERAQRHLIQAFPMLTEAEDRYGVAVAQMLLAQVQLAQGKPSEAELSLQEARDQFKRLGAQLDLARAQALAEEWYGTPVSKS
jgi:class 3 adenylate cyclase/tetratricopeptide (TPR) repeat protein